MFKNKKGFFEKLKRVVTIGSKQDSDLEIEEDDDLKEETTLEDEEGQLAIDMCQTSSEIIIKTMIAGVKPDDLDIAITRDMVTIRGKRTESQETEENDFFDRELYWGSFSRTIILPTEIEIEAAEASKTRTINSYFTKNR